MKLFLIILNVFPSIETGTYMLALLLLHYANVIGISTNTKVIFFKNYNESYGYFPLRLRDFIANVSLLMQTFSIYIRLLRSLFIDKFKSIVQIYIHLRETCECSAEIVNDNFASRKLIVCVLLGAGELWCHAMLIRLVSTTNFYHIVHAEYKCLQFNPKYHISPNFKPKMAFCSYEVPCTRHVRKLCLKSSVRQCYTLHITLAICP